MKTSVELGIQYPIDIPFSLAIFGDDGVSRLRSLPGEGVIGIMLQQIDVKDGMDFDGIGKLQLYDQGVGKHLADAVGADISVIQLDCGASGLDISGA